MVTRAVLDLLPALYPGDPPHGLGVDCHGHPVGLGQHLPVLLGYRGRGEGAGVGAPPAEDGLVRVPDDVERPGYGPPLAYERHLQKVQVLGFVHEHHVRITWGLGYLQEAGLDQVGEVEQHVSFLPLGPPLDEYGHGRRHPVRLHPGPEDLVLRHQVVALRLPRRFQVVPVDPFPQVVGPQAHHEIGLLLVPLLNALPGLGYLRLAQGVVAMGVQGAQGIEADG